VELRVSAHADGANARTVVVQPISGGAERTLLYRDWIESNRAYVDKISNGKLGYVHIRDMSENRAAPARARSGRRQSSQGRRGGRRASQQRRIRERVRDRRAGAARLPHDDAARPARIPARTSLGQRSLELPTILVTNQHSLSDAEDFTEGYRQLKLGKVVGEPTAGWIIFTGSATLIDGTSIRMPGTRITSNDGQTMELNPRPVDMPVSRPIGESYTGRTATERRAELLRRSGVGTAQEH
jgi:C-terminal processing protease CtpA/Prc